MPTRAYMEVFTASLTQQALFNKIPRIIFNIAQYFCYGLACNRRRNNNRNANAHGRYYRCQCLVFIFNNVFP